MLDRDATLLMADPGRLYAAVAGFDPPISEVLMVPFHDEGGPIGEVWVIAHAPALEKLVLRSRADLVQFALARGWLQET